MIGILYESTRGSRFRLIKCGLREAAQYNCFMIILSLLMNLSSDPHWIIEIAAPSFHRTNVDSITELRLSISHVSFTLRSLFSFTKRTLIGPVGAGAFSFSPLACMA